MLVRPLDASQAGSLRTLLHFYITQKKTLECSVFFCKYRTFLRVQGLFLSRLDTLPDEGCKHTTDAWANDEYPNL